MLQTGHLPTQVFQNLPGTMTHAPILLIVNRATASASEVLAGALRDNGRQACKSQTLHECTPLRTQGSSEGRNERE